MAAYLPPEVLAIIDSVDSYLRWSNINQPPRGHERYHPSAFGNCLRQMQYDRYHERGWVEKKTEDPEPWLLRIFGVGHSMHDRWRSYFEELGVLKGYWTCTNPFCAAWDDNGKMTINPDHLMNNVKNLSKQRRSYGRNELQGVFKPKQCVCGWNKFHYDEIDIVDEEMNIYGHCDMVLDFTALDKSKFEGVKQVCNFEHLPTGPVVVDMKTINHFEYQKIAGGSPHDYYVVQLMIYANILKCDYGVLIYENKNNQRVAAFKIDKRENDYWPQIRRQAILMNDMVEVEDEGRIVHLLPPPRPDSKDHKNCEYCGYKEICHSSPIWDDPELNAKRKEFYGDLL